MIELKQVSKYYGSNVLFQDVSYIFKDGHKYLIKGDNGVGKSVSLKLIVGHARVNQGVLLEDGKSYEFLRNEGVSINAHEFIDHLTGLENLLELAKIKKIIKKDEILVLGK